jgi:uncharacterized protein (TIGR03435 family)
LPKLSTFLLIVWLSGAAILLVPMMVGLIRVHRLRWRGHPWRDGQLLVASIASALGVRRPIQVLLEDAADGPITCGGMRPAIIFPPDAPRWAMDDLRRAIVHEIEHVRRADWLMLCLARTVCAGYWFHPLVWMLWKQLRLDAERACDDAVLRTADAEIYADQLVTLAERLVSHRPPSALAMANGHDLFARVSAVLDYSRQRGRAGSLRIASALGVGVLAIVGIAPLQAVPGPLNWHSAEGRGLPVVTLGERLDASARVVPTAHITNATPRATVPSPGATMLRIEHHTPSPTTEVDSEIRDTPVYVLTLNDSGQLGPNLRRATKDCFPREACEGFTSLVTEYRGAQWPFMLRAIASRLDHPLVDRTGLSGLFDFELAYGFGLVPARDDSRPDVFTAVRRQLGLKLVLSGAAIAPGPVQGQTAPVFDVASIKPTAPNPPVTTIGNFLPGGRWSARNVTVRMILGRAYPEYSLPGLIVGGPSWVAERRFDIDASADPTVTPAQYPAMIRQLLADRFKLKTHVEPRPVDVYSLVLARRNGPLGPQLRPASAECAKELEAARALEKTRLAGLTPSGGPEPKPCGVQVSMADGLMRIAGGRSMKELAEAIQSWTDLKVVDRTGLVGDYQSELKFDFRGTVSPNSDPDKPSLFTAVQEQLGLRLQRSREPVGVLVIETIEVASEN